MMDDQPDICRVCRSEGAPDRPLFYPCVCTGSIKYIHQECLVQWLRYSRKEYCELCNHRFSFQPIYAPDMPKRLPIKDVVMGLVKSVATAVRFWLHYTLVAFAWLVAVPLSACRIHRSLFSGSVNSILSLPLDLLSTENLVSDIFNGCVVVMCTLCFFISLVWLREHIMHGGGPDWLDPQQQERELWQDVIDHMNDEGVGAAANENGGNNRDGNFGNNNHADNAVPEVVDEDNNNNNDGAQLPEAVVAQNVNGNNNDDVNWNPIEWDRAAEELTWERLLGLDGSLIFIEHVFWVVSLNTLFVLVFEFCPYHIGHFAIAGLQLQEKVKVQHFEGLLVTLCGYCVVGLILVLLHTIASLCRFRKSKKVLGICYVVVKVCLLSVVEIGIFPLVCGWWLDICSLQLFDATLKDRETSFNKAPGTTMFMHWLFGMVYVFYFASCILLLREVLRPGVLWFLRNLNDPDFNPIQEMIHLPILRHIRRFLISMIIFGTTILLMIWLPIRIIKKCLPSFLPYTFVFTTEQAHELSLELVLLQVMMPALLEQGHTREWLKTAVRWWCIAVSWVLDLRSYLLGDVPDEVADEGTGNGAPANANVDDPANPEEDIVDDEDLEEIEEDDEEELFDDDDDLLEDPAIVARGPVVLDQGVQAAPNNNAGPAGGLGIVMAGGGLGAAHQALLLRDGPTGFQQYRKPLWFPLKIVLLILSICLTLTVVSVGVLTIPVWIGRLAMGFWLSNSNEPVHELYTAASGLYLTWLTIRLSILVGTWLPRGWMAIWDTVRRWSITVAKATIAVGVLIGLVPYLCGLLFELILFSPLRVPIFQSPVYLISENWVMGTLYVKIACATTMMTPQNFWLRRTLERIYNDGFRNINLNFILKELAAPCIMWLGLALSIPYVMSHSIAPIFVKTFETQNLIERRIYPFILIIGAIIGIIYFQIRQFKKLYEHIKNDKYLVGRRLVNYERPPPVQTAPSQPTAAPAAAAVPHPPPQQEPNLIVN